MNFFSAFLVILSDALYPHSPPARVHAYLDPGSGSFILQVLLAALLGGMFLIKTYWQKIIGIFHKSSPEDKPEQNNDHEAN